MRKTWTFVVHSPSALSTFRMLLPYIHATDIVHITYGWFSWNDWDCRIRIVSARARVFRPIQAHWRQQLQAHTCKARMPAERTTSFFQIHFAVVVLLLVLIIYIVRYVVWPMPLFTCVLGCQVITASAPLDSVRRGKLYVEDCNTASKR